MENIAFLRPNVRYLLSLRKFYFCYVEYVEKITDLKNQVKKNQIH